LILKGKYKLGMVVYTCKPSTLEADGEGLQVEDGLVHMA
jgi:hypothetical protein